MGFVGFAPRVPSARKGQWHDPLTAASNRTFTLKIFPVGVMVDDIFIFKEQCRKGWRNHGHGTYWFHDTFTLNVKQHKNWWNSVETQTRSISTGLRVFSSCWELHVGLWYRLSHGNKCHDHLATAAYCVLKVTGNKRLTTQSVQTKHLKVFRACAFLPVST